MSRTFFFFYDGQNRRRHKRSAPGPDKEARLRLRNKLEKTPRDILWINFETLRQKMLQKLTRKETDIVFDT